MISFDFENRHAGLVAGVDEAGRGPWAGPVVAAAVILDRAQLPPGLNDSKKLSEVARERLFEPIMASSRHGIGMASVAEITTRLARGTAAIPFDVNISVNSIRIS